MALVEGLLLAVVTTKGAIDFLLVLQLGSSSRLVCLFVLAASNCLRLPVTGRSLFAVVVVVVDVDVEVVVVVGDVVVVGGKGCGHCEGGCQWVHVVGSGRIH